MLIIRNEQMDAFQDHADGALVAWVTERLGLAYPDEVAALSDEEIASRVRGAIARGRGYGFADSTALATFAGLSFTCGPRFDEHPAIRRALTDPSKPAEARLSALLDETPSGVWYDASRIGEERP